ncbi:PoNe immunity protein domain-containing protein [Acetivibrio clariflavus]|nr:PoNe immunity protein domain-containing protein [Acetivibrio clariflavus]
MRDPLCNESYLLKTIESKKKNICETKQEIAELKADIEKGDTKISKR